MGLLEWATLLAYISVTSVYDWLNWLRIVVHQKVGGEKITEAEKMLLTGGIHRGEPGHNVKLHYLSWWLFCLKEKVKDE